MWYLPGPGLEPVSPELAGGFLTTATPPPTKPLFTFSKHIGWVKFLSNAEEKVLGICGLLEAFEDWKN